MGRNKPSLQLDIPTVLAIVPILRGEHSRLAVRDMLIRTLAETLPGGIWQRAVALGEELKAPEYDLVRSRALSAIQNLSRQQNAPTAHQIYRVLGSDLHK